MLSSSSRSVSDRSVSNPSVSNPSVSNHAVANHGVGKFPVSPRVSARVSPGVLRFVLFSFVALLLACPALFGSSAVLGPIDLAVSPPATPTTGETPVPTDGPREPIDEWDELHGVSPMAPTLWNAPEGGVPAHEILQLVAFGEGARIEIGCRPAAPGLAAATTCAWRAVLSHAGSVHVRRQLTEAPAWMEVALGEEGFLSFEVGGEGRGEEGFEARELREGRMRVFDAAGRPLGEIAPGEGMAVGRGELFLRLPAGAGEVRLTLE